MDQDRSTGHQIRQLDQDYIEFPNVRFIRNLELCTLWKAKDTSKVDFFNQIGTTYIIKNV